MSPEDAATYAIEHYDANHDGNIDSNELKACGPLAAASVQFDSDGDGALTSIEIIEGLKSLNGSGSNLTEASCRLVFAGQPLVGAEVTLTPAEMLGASLPTAKGITDELGVARPKIDETQLPEEFRSIPLVTFGLYKVEITHPQKRIPARYNTATELGWLIAPASRTGTSAEFTLKSE